MSETISSFWTELYGAKEEVADYLRASLLVQRELAERFNQNVDALARSTCRRRHIYTWLPISIYRDDRVSARTALFTDLYTSPTPTTSAPIDVGGAYELDQVVEAATAISLSPLDSTEYLLAYGVDFTFDSANSRVIFVEDPFNAAELADKIVPTADGDRLDLWICQAEVQSTQKSDNFGPSAGLPQRQYSTKSFDELLDCLAEASLSGPQEKLLRNGILAAAGAPVVRTDGETVEVIDAESDGGRRVFTATDTGVYWHPEGAVATVAVDDVVGPGDSLCDTIRFWRYSSADSTVPAWITGIPLGPDHIRASGYAGNTLTFANSLQTLTVVGTVSSETKVSFPITGDSGDATAFIDQLHTNGVASGWTLADTLDSRRYDGQSPITPPPSAGELPAQVNPAQIIADSGFLSGVLVVGIDSTLLGSDTRYRPDTDGRATIRKTLTPPGFMPIFVSL